MTSPKLTIIRIKAVMALINLSRSTIYDYLNTHSPRYDHTFPKPVKLGASAIGWVEHEVQAWINLRIQDRQTREDCA